MSLNDAFCGSESENKNWKDQSLYNVISLTHLKYVSYY